MSKILVIEDDNSVRAGIIELLNEEGFETYQAENGKIGIELAKQLYPDLIISDILMPEVDGYGVLREMQKEQSTSLIPFIFLSARTEASDIRVGMREGADDYLTKPYKAVDLLDAVNSRMSKKNKSEKRLNEVFKSISLSLPHEFRTPLISILGFSQIIKEDVYKLDPGEIQDMVEKINTSGYDLLNMIEKFLTFSRLETFDVSIGQSKIDSVISAKGNISVIALKIAEQYTRTSDIKLELSEASLKICPEHFEKFITEILDNCFKFSSKGSLVEIKSTLIDGFYFLEFTDKGIGMTKDQIREIGALRQFDRSKNNQKGTGLGLAIVNKIVEINQLGFKIESDFGISTKVKIFIPVNK